MTALGGAAIAGLLAFFTRLAELKAMKKARDKREKEDLIRSRKSGSESVARDDISDDKIY